MLQRIVIDPSVFGHEVHATLTGEQKDDLVQVKFETDDTGTVWIRETEFVMQQAVPSIEVEGADYRSIEDAAIAHIEWLQDCDDVAVDVVDQSGVAYVVQLIREGGKWQAAIKSALQKDGSKAATQRDDLLAIARGQENA